jgi:hypothetical protein
LAEELCLVRCEVKLFLIINPLEEVVLARFWVWRAGSPPASARFLTAPSSAVTARASSVRMDSVGCSLTHKLRSPGTTLALHGSSASSALPRLGVLPVGLSVAVVAN